MIWWQVSAMPKNNHSAQRKKTATALRSLADILIRNEVCADIGPLHAAAAQCADHSDKTWGYDINNLVFQSALPKDTMPNDAKNFRIVLSSSFLGHFDREADDRFSKLEINIEKYAQASGGKELKAAWHLDRHLIDTGADSPHITEDIHPLYHFQFGGARLREIAEDLGRVLMVEAPRIMHPPMDGILAIDFVLANYLGGAWKSLRNDDRYSNLVTGQHKHLWKPYFDSLALSWSTARPNNSCFICPFVLNDPTSLI